MQSVSKAAGSGAEPFIKLCWTKTAAYRARLKRNGEHFELSAHSITNQFAENIREAAKQLPEQLVQGTLFTFVLKGSDSV